MDENRLYLGIDYGGNAVKLGLVDSYGNLQGKTSWPTVDLTEKADCRAFAMRASDFVHGLGVYSSELGGVGLAIPGFVAQESYYVANVEVDWPLLLDCLQHTFPKIPVRMLNDANAAALGEMWMGAGGESRSALLVTLGSGVGAGLIVEGNVISGGHGAAGEIGHMTIVPNGRQCRCGRRGCMERYVSARGIAQTFIEASEDDSLDHSKFSEFKPRSETDAYPVFKAFEVNDPRAVKALADMADKLGFALAQVSSIVDPDLILLGGGVSGGARYFIDDLRAAYRGYCHPACATTEIRIANLSSDAGIYGAARYAMMSVPRDSSQRDWLDPDFGL